MTRLLIIDDDSLVRQLIVETLQHEYEIITAHDGTYGVELAEAYRPDLIICDINMPEMDGFTVLRLLQNIEHMANVPFIFLAGTEDYSVIRQGMGLGADDFLTKPFDIAELRQTIHKRLEKAQQRQAILTKAIDELRLNITTALPHELRTAIMIVEGYAHLILDDAEIDPIQREMIGSIYENAARLRHMAEKYLWYLKTYLPNGLVYGEVTRNPEQVIEHIIVRVAQRFNRASDLRVHLETAAICIRDEYLSKIAEEIIENAFKFSRAGTSISVLGAVSQNTYALTICNFGHQMTPEQIDRIGGFMQFNRAQYEQQGTGLGLIVVKRLIEACGGQFSIESTGKKTSVTILFPLDVPENQDNKEQPIPV